MANITDSTIKNALGNSINTALTNFYSPTVIALPVYRHWILSNKIGEVLNLMKPRTGLDANKIHGWMIGVAGRESYRPVTDDVLSLARKGQLRKVGPAIRDIKRRYRVWVYKQYSDGQPGSEETINSENQLMSELDFVTDYLDGLPTLNITDRRFQGHNGLQFSVIDTFNFGDTMVNLAQGEIEVIVRNDITSNQAETC